MSDGRWTSGPAHDYHVVFWRQATAPEGFPQEQMVWAADENDVLGGIDLFEVLEWVDAEARRRSSTYTLYAILEYGGHKGMVWLAGVDPTKPAGPNFEREFPADVNPVGGDAEDVYRARPS